MPHAGWNTQQGKDADSPSVGREERPYAQHDESPHEATATGHARTAQGGPVQLSGQGNPGQDDDKEQERGDDLLEPLPGSPDGLAPADLLGSENPRAAAFEAHARCSFFLPAATAPIAEERTPLLALSANLGCCLQSTAYAVQHQLTLL